MLCTASRPQANEWKRNGSMCLATTFLSLTFKKIEQKTALFFRHDENENKSKIFKANQRISKAGAVYIKISSRKRKTKRA